MLPQGTMHAPGVGLQAVSGFNAAWQRKPKLFKKQPYDRPRVKAAYPYQEQKSELVVPNLHQLNSGFRLTKRPASEYYGGTDSRVKNDFHQLVCKCPYG
jgi:hypothetical protein